MPEETLVISSAGSDRATAYHMSTKMVAVGSELWITWLANPYQIRVSRVDLQRWQVTAEVPLVQGYDNHSGASLAVDPDSRLHVMAGSHHQSFIHRFSASPADPGSWSVPHAVGRVATYPSTAVSSAGPYLHLAYRSSSDPWTLLYQRASLAADPPDWTEFWNGKPLLQAPSPGYCYWTNSLAVDSQGVVHLLAEFYKRLRKPFGYSPAVTHLYSENEGLDWQHTDGRPLEQLPVGLENITPILFRGGGDLRPSGLTVLSDDTLAFTIGDNRNSQLLFCRKKPGSDWALSDWAGTLGTALPSGYTLTKWAALAEDSEGTLFGCTTVAPERQFGHPRSQLLFFRVDPEQEQPVDIQLLPMFRQDEPDWLPVLKAAPGLPGRCLILHQSGKRAEQNVNTQQTQVILRMVSG